MSIEQSAIGLISKDEVSLDTKYYVYYNQYTGAISAVCSSPHEYIEDPELVVTLEQSDAPSCIIAGTKSVADFIVAYDDSDQLAILGKGDVIRWTKKSSKLIKIPVNFNTKLKSDYLDVRFLYHTRDNVVRLIVTDKIRQRIADPIGNKQFRIAGGSALSIFLTDKNDPDAIHQTLEFNLEDLVREREVIIEDFELDVKNLALFSADNFQHYRFDVTQSRYITTRYDDDIRQRINEVTHDDGVSHILLNQIDAETLEITNRIERMEEVKHFDPEFKLYVCNEDPDQYEGELKFDLSDLGVNRPATFKVPINLKDKTILYSGNRMKVTLKG